MNDYSFDVIYPHGFIKSYSVQAENMFEAYNLIKSLYPRARRYVLRKDTLS